MVGIAACRGAPVEPADGGDDGDSGCEWTSGVWTGPDLDDYQPLLGTQIRPWLEGAAGDWRGTLEPDAWNSLGSPPTTATVAWQPADVVLFTRYPSPAEGCMVRLEIPALRGTVSAGDAVNADGSPTVRAYCSAGRCPASASVVLLWQRREVDAPAWGFWRTPCDADCPPQTGLTVGGPLRGDAWHASVGWFSLRSPEQPDAVGSELILAAGQLDLARAAP